MIRLGTPLPLRAVFVLLPALHRLLAPLPVPVGNCGERGPLPQGPGGVLRTRSVRAWTRRMQAVWPLASSEIEAQGLVTDPLHVRAWRRLTGTMPVLARRHWQHAASNDARARPQGAGEGNDRCDRWRSRRTPAAKEEARATCSQACGSGRAGHARLSLAAAGLCFGMDAGCCIPNDKQGHQLAPMALRFPARGMFP